jgi:DNA-binding phage protein
MCKAAHMELHDLMAKVDATDQTVAEETGLNRSTIYRIRHKTTAPSAETMLLLNDWAEVVRRVKLDWSYLKGE